MEYRVSQDSMVGTGIHYELEELDGLGIKSWWGEIFRTHPDQSNVMGTRSLLRRGKVAEAWH